MPIISSLIKGIFGDKSVKDRKLIRPIVEEINEFQKSLESISDEGLKSQYSSLKIELSDLIKTKKQEFESKKIEEADIDDQLNQIENTFLDEKFIKTGLCENCSTTELLDKIQSLYNSIKSDIF